MKIKSTSWDFVTMTNDFTDRNNYTEVGHRFCRWACSHWTPTTTRDWHEGPLVCTQIVVTKSISNMFRQLLYFVLLLVFPRFVTSSSFLEDSISDSNGIFSESIERSLLLSVPCLGAAGKQNYFNIVIQVIQQGGFTPYNCTSASYQQFGMEINTVLSDYGVGVAGVGDNAAFLARVCTDPTMKRRRLAAKGFVWMGGGACRYCKGDNFDKRGLQWTDPNWFTNIYAPELENKLRNAIVERVKKYKYCFGNGPQVLVNVQEVPLTQVMDGCITPATTPWTWGMTKFCLPAAHCQFTNVILLHHFLTRLPANNTR